MYLGQLTHTEIGIAGLVGISLKARFGVLHNSDGFLTASRQLAIVPSSYATAVPPPRRGSLAAAKVSSSATATILTPPK